METESLVRITAPNGITDPTARVDRVYGWQVIEHKGKRYVVVEGESADRIVSKNVHEYDSGKLIYCAETSREYLERNRSYVEKIMNLSDDPIGNFEILIHSVLSKYHR